MIRLIMLPAAVIGAGLLTTSCTPTLTPEQIAEIQTTAVQICGFLPTGVQIAQLIPNAAVQTTAIAAQPIAQAICAVVTAAPAGHAAILRGAIGQDVTFNANVRGGYVVTVTGRFVDPARAASFSARRHH